MPAGRRYGVIGGGMMGQAIVRSLLAAGLAPADAVTVSHPAPGGRESLSNLGARLTTSNLQAAADADVLLLCVKPAVVPTALAEVGPHLRPQQLLISIAAGVPVSRIEALVVTGVPVVRAMPNVLITVRAGVTALCGGSSATEEHLAIAREVFEAGGRVVEVAEGQLDAVTGLSGSGPGYVMLVIEALADGGVLSGLPRATALALAAQTVLGTAALLLEAGDHPAEWKDRVATPGGTTIAGLAELETAGVRGAFIRAVEAAARRARDLALKG